jgi:uncharacterized membrane protein
MPLSRPGSPSSRIFTAHAVAVAGLSAAHSMRARGLRRTLIFAALGTAIPAVGEYLAINVIRALRHHARPQAKGVPLAIVLGWYNVSYAVYSVTESLLATNDLKGSRRRPALPLAVALLATDLDLLLDPAGLDAGLWEWHEEGAYAKGVRGRNGRRGVPLYNYAGWLAIESSIASSYRSLAPDEETADAKRPWAAGGPESGRAAALILLLYYLPAAVWAVRRRGWRYLLYSAPFTGTLCLALKGRRPAP